jgi:ribokinase
MASILVSGLINIETTLRVEGFPIPYEPVRYPFNGVHSTVSGVGYNIARALTVLGHEARLLSIVGRDPAAGLIRQALAAEGIADACVLGRMPHTAQSVILYDEQGRRMIHVDLKDVQDQEYPADVFDTVLEGCDLAVLCNVNFSRALLARAKRAGVRIATDVHTIASLDDPYNTDFMRHADILFMSDERLPMFPEDWARAVGERYGCRIIVIGMGAQGALLHVRGEGITARIPAAHVRPAVNTIGAGDALFSAFLHGYIHTGDPDFALRKAAAFAAYKVGARGAAEGFLDAASLDDLYAGLSQGTIDK